MSRKQSELSLQKPQPLIVSIDPGAVTFLIREFRELKPSWISQRMALGWLLTPDKQKITMTKWEQEAGEEMSTQPNKNILVTLNPENKG